MAPPPPISMYNNSILQPSEKLVISESIKPGINYDTKELVPFKQETKTYEEIVDSFSSHQIIFRKGRIMATPEFQSFNRVNSEQ